MEAQGVLRFSIAPAVVRESFQNFEAKLVEWRIALGRHESCDSFGFLGAEVGRLEDRPQRAFGGHRIALHKVAAGAGHAAKVLRPGAIQRGVDDSLPDLVGTELKGLLRKGQEGVHFALDEESHRFGDALSHNPVDVGLWIHSDVGHDAGDEYMIQTPDARNGDGLALQIVDTAHPVVPNQFPAARMHAGENGHRLTGVDREHDRAHAHHGEVRLARR